MGGRKLGEAWLRTFQVKQTKKENHNIVKLENSFSRSFYKYCRSLGAQMYSLYFHIHCNSLNVSHQPPLFLKDHAFFLWHMTNEHDGVGLLIYLTSIPLISTPPID